MRCAKLINMSKSGKREKRKEEMERRSDKRKEETGYACQLVEDKKEIWETGKTGK